MYYRYGPTPRICFSFLKDKELLSNHETRFKKALYKLSTKTLLDMVSDACEFKTDDISNTILLVKRVDVSGRTGWARESVEPITHAVSIELRNQLDKETRGEQLQLYRSLASVEGTRRIAGVLYEALAQSKLLTKIELNLVPMVTRKLARSGQVRGLPRWHSNHGDGGDPSSVRPLNIEPVRKEVYTSRPVQIEDKVYYAPDIQNQVAFDAFIMADQKLYIFQFTIGSGHGIKKGIVTFFTQESLPPKADWHFVFVVPPEPGLELSCPQSQEDLGLRALLLEMKLFTAVLDPE
jgi:hypothetical protein